jgi:hypothetical protein
MKRLPDPTFDQRVADWLEEDPTIAPREVLATVLAAYPSITQRPSMRRPWRFHPMYRLALPAAAALVVVVSGALLLPRLLVPPAGNQSPSPSIDGTSLPATQLPTFPPVTPTPPPAVQDLVVFQARILFGTTRSTVWVQSSDGTISRDLLPDEPGSWLLGRTGDGSRVLVALSGEEPSMALVDVNTGEQEPVPTDCPSDPCWADSGSVFGHIGAVSLADDGRTAVVVLRDDDTGHESIATVALATGATSIIEGSRGIFVPGPGLRYPRLSPDGQSLAYVVANGDPRACFSSEAGMIVVVDRFGDADTQRQLVPFRECATDPRWSPTGADLVYSTAEVTIVPIGTPTPPGGTTSIARENHDVYRVTLAGDIERLTEDRMSSYGAWTRDGRISYASCDPNCDEPVLVVWIHDPESGERSRIGGTLAALGEAGCIECPFLRDLAGPQPRGLVVGLWSHK